ncbi:MULTISPECIES: hypothetical protein [Pseudomonas syringae group]|uniref:hypothetical protein n=1 Tax=Pseudomonas syringae group TaxID=136849 RepID=UPI0018E5BF3F|nr:MULTISPECIES: hypothetical protein [Pseudomonas syringae group]MBI6843712.1 hypothetical protein [Pseudomonas syringae]MBX6472951.1 hypothetical protein [Pseudomonas syringae pv. tomato]MBX6500207.1 hypothetical protein [Pseudomonas syringae pv. tomato]MBX6505717.1 hypothetical protein [Pseudomonas syringae pv. tomato]MBX6540842.1 hypothetical protein [Pseudomonas syringae pv. tomato]
MSRITVVRIVRQASPGALSGKLQASSFKLQASSFKLQASSFKLQAFDLLAA